MLAHFDTYITGKGLLQKPTDDTWRPFGWMPIWNSPEPITILNRRIGKELPTAYEAPIHQAPKAVAELVAAAAQHLEVLLSPLLRDLTGSTLLQCRRTRRVICRAGVAGRSR